MQPAQGESHWYANAMGHASNAYYKFPVPLCARKRPTFYVQEVKFRSLSICGSPAIIFSDVLGTLQLRNGPLERIQQRCI